MKRKIYSLFILTIFILNLLPAVVLAQTATKDEADQKAINDSKKTVITLSEVEKRAAVYGSEYKSAKATEAIAEASGFKAEMTYYDAKYDAEYNLNPAAYVTMYTADAEWDDAISELNRAEKKTAQQSKLSAYTGVDLYFNYLNLSDTLAMTEKAYELQKKSFEIAKVSLKRGYLSKDAYNEQETALLETENNIEMLKDNLTIIGRSLLIQCGYDEDLDFKLDTSIDFTNTTQSFNATTVADNLVSKSVTIKELDDNIETIEDFFDSDDISSVDVPTKEVMAANGDMLKTQRKIAVNGYKTAAISAVNTLNSAKRAMNLASKKLKLAEKAYKVAQKRASLGKDSNVTLLQNEITYLQAVNNDNSAKRSYYLSYKYVQLLNSGVVPATTSY